MFPTKRVSWWGNIHLKVVSRLDEIMVEKGIFHGVFSRRIGVNSVDICYGGPYDSDKASEQIEQLEKNYKIEPRQENTSFFAKLLKEGEGEL